MTFDEWWLKFNADTGPYDDPSETEVVTRLTWTDATEAERERCVNLITHYLQFDGQRAVSWHEVRDCKEAIRKGNDHAS